MDINKAEQLTLISPQFRYPLSTISKGNGCFIPDLTSFPKETIQEDRTSTLKPRPLAKPMPLSKLRLSHEVHLELQCRTNAPA